MTETREPEQKQSASFSPEFTQRIEAILRIVYPQEWVQVRERIVRLLNQHPAASGGHTRRQPDEGTAFLITYGDAIQRPGESPLRTLRAVLDEHVGETVTAVHILPMFPWTSDDGFAVVDYRKINPMLGDWDDVAALASTRALMFDFVANHASSQNPWFTGWLERDPRYDGFFIEEDPGFDVSEVVRPRTSPLFHRFSRNDGSAASVWTTFGADQVDLDVRQPATLLELTDVLLGYVRNGASAIRLDAIGFLWKESGTRCIHLPQTHAIIRLWRAILDELAPGVQLITETNVPHRENISYFGSGSDEAHQVYQFALPPLVLHSFVSGDTTALTRWAQGIGPVSETATWFNFLASHDGIGLRPVEDLLTADQRDALVARALAHGGRVGMATKPDGTQQVYELNVAYLDALCTPAELDSAEVVAAKALAAHSILLAVLGVPAIYYHSLFGSRSDVAGMEASGINRRINREVLDADRLAQELEHDPRRRGVFGGLRQLLSARRRHVAFSPFGTQRVVTDDPRLFVVRRAEGTPDEVVCVANVSGDPVSVPWLAGGDLLTGEHHESVSVAPYGFAWVKPD